MISIDAFMSQLRELNVRLWADGEELRCRAPKGTMTPELTRELSERKAEILFYLRRAAGLTRPRERGIEPVARDRPLPLSFAQQRLWFLDRFEGPSATYTMALAVRLHGALHVAALQQALVEITRRHEVLRTNFTVVEEQPVTRIRAAADCPLSIVELGGVSDGAQAEEVRRWAQEEAGRCFDLAQDRLLHATLLRLGDTSHLFGVSMHHIISDGWSLGVFIRELATLYETFSRGLPSPLPDLTIQYADYAHWQRERLRGEVLEVQLAYWRGQLAGAPEILHLPTDRPRPPLQTHGGQSLRGAIDAQLTARLQAISRASGTTLFMTLLAGFAILLSRYSGQDDIVVGTAVAHRNHPDLEALIGLFVNTLVLRLDLSGDPTVEDLLLRVRQTCLQAYDHQDVPFEKLVEELKPPRNLSHAPLFQVTIDLQNAPMAEVEMSGLTLLPVEQEAVASKFDFSLSVEERGAELSALVQYNPDLFDDATVARMLEHYRVLLDGLVNHPRWRLSQLPLLDAAERERLLYAWDESAEGYPPVQTFLELFEAWVDKAPDRVAVSFEGEALTYGQLHRRANHLAYHLRRLGVGPEARVALCMERSLEMVVGLLGILKAGGAYIPLDPAYPRERLGAVLEDARPIVVLTQEHLAPTLPEIEARVVCLAPLTPTRTLTPQGGGDVGDEGQPLLIPSPLEGEGEDGGDNAGAVSQSAAPGNVAYVIYTSGSTGRPKGVQITHRALVNFLMSMQREPGLTEQDVLLAVTTIAFDIAGLELYLPLITGARLVLADRETAMDGRTLQVALQTSQATFMQATPATWRTLIETGWDPTTPLRIICGGEALPTDLAAQLLRRGVELWNLYGPTETTIWSAIRRVTHGEGERRAAEGVEPIGRPINNTQLYLLDGRGQPLPIGVPGELYIGGDGLARGYLQQPQLTAACYLPDPFAGDAGARLYRTGDLARRLPNGEIEFLGRIDYQVKVRGYRIELGEIEAALRQHPHIRDAVVLAREDTPGDKRLTAYLVASAEQPPQTDELRVYLKTTLPDFMIPAVFVVLPSLPLTPNGKVNRRALPAPDQSRPELQAAYARPRTELEQMVAEIWREVLRVDQVGIDDNFFDLGGHSLLMTQVHEALRTRLARPCSLIELFQYPTIRTLAARLAQEEEAGPAPILVRPRSSSGTTDAIAIIGMAGRFPGAEDLEAFWRNLRDGRESITFFSDEELLAAGMEPDLIANPQYVKANGILTDITGFDARFFGFTPAEAEVMDPQHRLFLECAWHTLEHAGYGARAMKKSIGVYAGCSHNHYLLANVLPHLRSHDSHAMYQVIFGNDKDFLPTRVSYALDLKGPSVNVQTACSTGLVAVHLACKSLLDGECDMALAGGVGLKIPQISGYLYQEGMIASPDGHCRAFDANAQGTTWGSGVGLVLLKRWDEALADRDSIFAVILGSAINNDGSLKVGFTAPGIEGQAEVIASAQARAGVSPDSISYVETHGTGTPLGDPIEITALTRAFRAGTNRKEFCALGSVKTNIGHLDTAAGIAGLLKTVLALQHRQIPPSLHFEHPNPEIDFATSPFYVNTRLRDWPAHGKPRRAGVSSFGIGGTNAHLILEEAPAPEPSRSSRSWQILVLSAHSRTAVEHLQTNTIAYLKNPPELALADVAYTLGIGRRPFDHRMAMVCRDHDDAAAALQDPERLRFGALEGKDREVSFLFPGQGAQYVGMGADIYRTEPVFRDQVDHCADLLREELGLDLRHVMYPQPEEAATAAEHLDQTWLTQPALFVTEYALARLWMSWGVLPRAMIGHSLGEYVAACLAGVFDLETALRLVARRGRLIWQQPAGAMLAVSLPAQEVRPLLGDTLSLAAVNTRVACVVSGPSAAVEELAARLNQRGVACRRLRTSHAFHSAMMDPVVAPFAEILQSIDLQTPRLPFISNLTGTWIRPEEATDAGYWGRHLRHTVDFEAGIGEMLQEPKRVLLEVGPGATLGAFVRQHPMAKNGRLVLSSLRRPEPAQGSAQEHERENRNLLDSLGRLWTAGVAVDWSGYYRHERLHRVPLPAYPFERQRYWIEAPAGEEPPHRGSREKKLPLEQWFYLPGWKPTLTPRPLRAGDLQGKTLPWLVLSDGGELSRQAVARLEGEGQEVITVCMGERYERSGERSFRIRPRAPEDYEALLQAVGQAPMQKILHFWSLSGADLSGPDFFETAQDRGYYSLLFLGRALAKQAHGPNTTLAVIANHLHDASGLGDICPEKATLLGPCLVIPQEMPQITCRCLDVVLPAARSGGEAALVDLLLGELEAGSNDPFVAYRGGRRLVPSFERVTLAPEGNQVRELRRQGVYLITGGLGHVGLHLARFLAETVQARLVLLGRSFFPERSQWASWLASHPEEDEIGATIHRLLELEALGAEVLLVRGDVANAEEMRAALKQVDDRFGVLHGVIHAAGLLRGPSFMTACTQIGEWESQAQFAPKVHGLYVLHNVLRERSLDFCLLVSSTSAVLGGLGFTAYSAANSFVDAFAAARNQSGGTPWLTTNWDTWVFEERSEPASLDEFSMSPRESVEAFRRVVSGVSAGRMIIATGDLSARFEQWVRRKEWLSRTASGASATPHARPSLATSYAAPATEVERRLAALWQELLGFQRVGIHDDFFELGGDSLSAIQLTATIQNTFGKQVPVAMLLNKPTIHQLADLLAQWEETFAFSPLVAIQPEGSLPAFFCVPGTGGNVVYLHELARALGEYGRPFYGFQAQGLDGRTKPLTRIEDIAAQNIQALQSVQARGPYHLGGHSFGSWVALEMARQLRRDGHEVAMVVVLDNAAPMERDLSEMAGWDDTRWLVTIAEILGHLYKKPIAFTYEALAHLAAPAQINVLTQTMALAGVLRPGIDANDMRGFVEVYKTQALIRYRPEPEPRVNLVLFRAREPSADIVRGMPEAMRQDETWGWQAYSEGKARVEFMPGDHLTMMVQPHVRVLASRLHAQLAQNSG